MAKPRPAPAAERAPLERAPIKPCICKHTYQDRLYGKGMRVHTVGGEKARPTFYCTVCGAQH